MYTLRSDHQWLVGLTHVEQDVFTNVNPAWMMRGRTGVAGSILLSQALLAAFETVPDNFSMHTVHATFLKASKSNMEILYHVERVRTGKRFATRTVFCSEGGTALANLTIGFACDQSAPTDPNLTHAVPMPTDLEAPEDGVDDFAKVYRSSSGGFVQGQRHPIILTDSADPSTRRTRQWIRTIGPEINETRLCQATLLYISDLYILDAPARLFDLKLGLGMPDRVQGGGEESTGEPGAGNVVYMGSLNHTVRVLSLEGYKAHEWTYMEASSEWAGNGRVVVSTRIFTRSGVLVASCRQEGLYKLKSSARASRWVAKM